MAAETGATAGWAGFNVHLAAGMLREAASLTTQIAGEVIPSDMPGCLAMAIRQPAGVVLGIAPWNAPVILGVRAIATPLACGNTVVLKASETCPGTHRLIGEACARPACRRAWSMSSPMRRPTRRRCRGDDRASGRAPRQLHRLDPGRQDHRAACGNTSSPRCWSSAARRRWSCWTTPTSTPR